MPVLSDFLSVLIPVQDTVTHLGDDAMIAFPAFKVDSTPSPTLGRHEFTGALEEVASREKGWIATLEAFIMLV